MSTETYSIPPDSSPVSCFDFQRNAYNRASASSIAWNIPADVLTHLAAFLTKTKKNKTKKHFFQALTHIAAQTRYLKKNECEKLFF